MGKRLITALAACSIFLALSATAAAQTGVRAKAMTATGSTAKGLSVRLSATVPRDTTTGEGCVWVRGYLNRRAVQEIGCGRLTVEINDLLNTGGARGTIDGIVLDVSVSGSGPVTPATAGIVFPNYPSCNGFFYIGWGCYLYKVADTANAQNPSVTLTRSGSAAGVVTGSSFGTTRFSGTGTLHLQSATVRPN